MQPWHIDNSDDAFSALASPTTTAATQCAAIAHLRAAALPYASIARTVRRSSSSLRHLHRVSRRLHPSLWVKLHTGALSLGHAKLLAGLAAERQPALADDAIAKRWSVATLARVIAGASVFDDDAAKAYYSQLNETFSEQLGFPAMIRPRSGGGVVEIRYADLNDFDALCARLKVDLSQD